MINNSLIIPCYNEEKNIKRLIELCKKYLNSDENELILVNNGSDDKTEEIIDYYCKIKNIKKVNIPINKGFGNGIVEGAKVSKGNIIIYTHADTEANPEDVLEGLQILKKTNSYEGNFLIKGNRIISAGVILPLSRQGISRYGTRHLAALGITERFDRCICVVVSEETGAFMYSPT